MRTTRRLEHDGAVGLVDLEDRPRAQADSDTRAERDDTDNRGHRPQRDVDPEQLDVERALQQHRGRGAHRRGQQQALVAPLAREPLVGAHVSPRAHARSASQTKKNSNAPRPTAPFVARVCKKVLSAPLIVLIGTERVDELLCLIGGRHVTERVGSPTEKRTVACHVGRRLPVLHALRGSAGARRPVGGRLRACRPACPAPR